MRIWPFVICLMSVGGLLAHDSIEFDCVTSFTKVLTPCTSVTVEEEF